MNALVEEARGLLKDYPSFALPSALLTSKQALQLVSETENPFSRTQFQPGHVTTSAFVVHPERPEVLLIHHRTLALWLQPGGHVEPGDGSLIASALREVAEETGATELEAVSPNLFDLDIHEIPRRPASGSRPEEPSHLHFDFRFLFQSQSAAIRAGSDALAARWFAFRELAAAPTDDSVRRAVARLASTWRPCFR